MGRLFRLYSHALRLYPAPFRSAYSQELRQTTSDMLAEAKTDSEKFYVWVRVWSDLLPSVLTEQINYQGAILMDETPKYLKAAGIVSALMLVPFFVALTLNTIDRALYHHNLYNSWLWHFPYLGLWVIWLPEIALVLAVASLAVYLVKGTSGHWTKRIFDVKHTWTVILPAVGAFGILFILAFHDSFQCLVVTPSHLVSHASAVYQCAVNNNSLAGFRKFL